LRAGAGPSGWPSSGVAIARGTLQGQRCDAGLLLDGEPLDLPVLLFWGHRGCPGERSLPRLEVDGLGTASPGSFWGSSCSTGMAMGAEGWLLGPPAKAADEVPGSSWGLDLAELLEGTGPGLGDPPREASGAGGSGVLEGDPPPSRPAALCPLRGCPWLPPAPH